MPAGGVKVRMGKASCRFVGAGTCRAHVLAKESLHEYPVAQLDQGRIPVSRGVSSLQRPRQVSSVVRRRRAKPMARMQWLSCTALLLAFLALLAGCQPAASPAPAARE